jgi:hypothetical protein
MPMPRGYTGHFGRWIGNIKKREFMGQIIKRSGWKSANPDGSESYYPVVYITTDGKEFAHEPIALKYQNYLDTGKWPSLSGDVYEGPLVNWRPHGKGKLTTPTGDIYEGDFVDGEFHGKGKMTWADKGDTYEGDFFYSLQHGKGKLTYADGRIYIGDFAKGAKNGKGTMTYPDGKIEEGNWIFNKFAG